jgi:hypothetical protein
LEESSRHYPHRQTPPLLFLYIRLFTVGFVVGFIKELGGASISLKNIYDGKISFKDYIKY